jgi:K+-transporting ATPase c subunit
VSCSGRGVFGETRMNVLELNLAPERLKH